MHAPHLADLQVESLAQLGVQLLLFHLGRELSFSKLKSVWSVALIGGTLQIVAFSALGGVVAAVLQSTITQVRLLGALTCYHVWCGAPAGCALWRLPHCCVSAGSRHGGAVGARQHDLPGDCAPVSYMLTAACPFAAAMHCLCAAGHFCGGAALYVIDQCCRQVPWLVPHERHSIWPNHHRHPDPAGEQHCCPAHPQLLRSIRPVQQGLLHNAPACAAQHKPEKQQLVVWASCTDTWTCWGCPAARTCVLRLERQGLDSLNTFTMMMHPPGMFGIHRLICAVLCCDMLPPHRIVQLV